MRIQHNIMAMNAYRNYTNNVSAMKGNLEKLSSGYKINRAGDDAAGLAISEKMRAQITGLTQAQNNAKSAINLVQTAEGALQEVQDMLNRMVKLAEQSANGTYDDGVDRKQLQKEFEKLTEEINRINKSANFNGKALFNGSTETDPTSLNDGIQTFEEGKESKIEGTASASIALDGTPAVAAVYESKITVTTPLVEGEKLTIGTKTFTVVADSTETKDMQDTDVKVSDIGDAAKLAQFIASNYTDSDYTVSTKQGAADTLVFTAKTPGAVGSGENQSGPDAAPTPPTLTVAKKEGEDNATGSVSAAAISSATTPGAEAENGTKIVNASGLTSTAIKTAADGTDGIEDGKVMLSKNNDGYLELKIGTKVIGTSTEKAPTTSSADTEITFTTDGKATGTSLGKVTLKSGVTAGDFTKAVETGLTYTAGEGGGDETKTVASSDLSTNGSIGGVDLVAAKTTKLATGEVAKLKAAFDALGSNTGKITVDGEVDVDLSKVTEGLTDGKSTVDDVLKNILNAAKAGADAWNAANTDKDYTYTNVRISKTADGAGQGDIIAQNAGDGIYILMDKTPRDADDGTGTKFTFQVGDTNAGYNKISLTIKSISSTAIKDISEGTEKTLAELKVDTETNAGEALSALKGMVNYISDIRGDLGATQNRLTHTINNLSVMTENIQDAESTIRDTDVADEMMAYTKNNILIQSAQAMLAQANQVPQGVLQLLQ